MDGESGKENVKLLTFVSPMFHSAQATMSLSTDCEYLICTKTIPLIRFNVSRTLFIVGV